ncbi:hypothetical protein QSJ18_11370 [Gordonia sp. ABSL1-1]|uniref:hypothetical protein n=1 Tax=Gordonia sp. ABSL1-1 TaxID=3053923 RepID=UPI002573CBB7|nr:hypothetical protein [Gordonia sp. ABSL1-1]MDL9937344.1 hypothetical protein [Gordonia sp. ABSL1-1]
MMSLILAAIVLPVAVMAGISGFGHDVDGSAGPEPYVADDGRIYPLAGKPQPMWTLPATAFGAQADASYVVAADADAHRVVVLAFPQYHDHDGVPLLVDSADGKPRWDAPSRFEADDCVLGADPDLLACVRNDHETMLTIGILDARTGAIIDVTTAPTRGFTSRVEVAGDGFLVVSDYRDNQTRKSAVELMRFGPDARRSWVQVPRPGLQYAQVSSAGRVVLAHYGHGGAIVYALDSGRPLFDDVTATARLRAAGQANLAFDAVVLCATGFAVGYLGTDVGRATRTELYDSDGRRRAVFDGFAPSPQPAGAEGTLLPVHDGRGEVAGVLSTRDARLVWQRRLSVATFDLALIGGRFVVTDDVTIQSFPRYRRILDLHTGVQRGIVVSHYDQELVASDDVRLIMTSVFSRLRTDPPAVAAYRVVDGVLAWEVRTVGDDADRFSFDLVGPYLFRTTAVRADQPAAVSRMAG